LSGPQGKRAAGRITSNEKYNEFTGNLPHDLPACSIVPEITTLLRAPTCMGKKTLKLTFENKIELIQDISYL
jgi:hypothetical protein